MTKQNQIAKWEHRPAPVVYAVVRSARAWNGDGFEGPYETSVVARYATREEAEEVAHARSMSDGSVATYGVEEVGA